MKFSLRAIFFVLTLTAIIVVVILGVTKDKRSPVRVTRTGAKSIVEFDFPLSFRGKLKLNALLPEGARTIGVVDLEDVNDVRVVIWRKTWESFSVSCYADDAEFGNLDFDFLDNSEFIIEEHSANLAVEMLLEEEFSFEFAKYSSDTESVSLSVQVMPQSHE